MCVCSGEAVAPQAMRLPPCGARLVDPVGRAAGRGGRGEGRPAAAGRAGAVLVMTLVGAVTLRRRDSPRRKRAPLNSGVIIGRRQPSPPAEETRIPWRREWQRCRTQEQVLLSTLLATLSP